MTGSEVLVLIARIGALWPNWRPPQDAEGFGVLVEEWTLQLAAADYEHALEAVRQTQRDGEVWPPGPGRVLRAALALSGVAFPPDPSEAWGEVEDAMRFVGRYGKPRWSHEAVREGVRRMGGFMSLCGSEDGMADRAHFVKTIYPPISAEHVRAALSGGVPALPAPVGPVAALGPARNEPRFHFSHREADLIGKEVP